MIRATVLLLLIALPASAADIRDKNGNLTGRFEQRDERTYLLDQNGNPRGYSVTHGGTTEIRTNDGNLVRRITR